MKPPDGPPSGLGCGCVVAEAHPAKNTPHAHVAIHAAPWTPHSPSLTIGQPTHHLCGQCCEPVCCNRGCCPCSAHPATACCTRLRAPAAVKPMAPVDMYPNPTLQPVAMLSNPPPPAAARVDPENPGAVDWRAASGEVWLHRWNTRSSACGRFPSTARASRSSPTALGPLWSIVGRPWGLGSVEAEASSVCSLRRQPRSPQPGCNGRPMRASGNSPASACGWEGRGQRHAEGAEAHLGGTPHMAAVHDGLCLCWPAVADDLFLELLRRAVAEGAGPASASPCAVPTPGSSSCSLSRQPGGAPR